MNISNLESFFNLSNNINIGSGHNIPLIAYDNVLLANPQYFLNLNNVFMHLN